MIFVVFLRLAQFYMYHHFWVPYAALNFEIVSKISIYLEVIIIHRVIMIYIYIYYSSILMLYTVYYISYKHITWFKWWTEASGLIFIAFVCVSKTSCQSMIAFPLHHGYKTSCQSITFQEWAW